MPPTVPGCRSSNARERVATASRVSSPVPRGRSCHSARRPDKARRSAGGRSTKNQVAPPAADEVRVSALTGAGLEDLHAALRRLAAGGAPESADGEFSARARQVDGLHATLDHATAATAELAVERMEKEVLKKATAYFARESLPGTRS